MAIKGVKSKEYIKIEYICKMENNKTICILVVSTTEEPLYDKLEQCCRLTWAKDILDEQYPNIDYWKVIDCKEESHIDLNNHTVYIKTNYIIKNIRQLLNRWLEAYTLLSNYRHYDYVFKMNPSTWINVEWFNIFLGKDTLEQNNIYTFNNLRYNSAFKDEFFLTGNLLIFPSAIVEILKDEIHNNYTSSELSFMDAEDLITTTILRKYLLKNNPKEKCNLIANTLHGQYITDKADNVDWNNIYNSLHIPCWQIATRSPLYKIEKTGFRYLYRMDDDCAKMKTLNIIWKLLRGHISNDDLEEMVNNYKNNVMVPENTHCIIIPDPTEEELTNLTKIETI